MQWIEQELRRLDARGLLRVPSELVPFGATGVRVNGFDRVGFCANDYLGLRTDRELIRASGEAAERWGTGSGASRLVSGNLPIHGMAEGSLAALVGAEAALLMSSGYAANVGALSALGGEGDVIFSDALNHASLIDGARLSRARTVVYPHCDVTKLGVSVGGARPFRRGFVVTESLFSMDGDIAPLSGLRALCDREGMFLYVDEAHALGLFGPQGAGLCAEAGVAPEVLVGTLGKALGAHGAFIAGALSLRIFLWNLARSFVFSTGVSPATAAVALAACARVRDPGLRAKLFENVNLLRAALAESGVRALGDHRSPIVPVVLGEAQRAMEASSALEALGFQVRGIRPPTVPEGSARLRVTVSAAHTREEILGLARALREVL